MSYEVEWSRVYGVDKDPVREFLIYPVLLPELGDLTGSVVADFGCGNGGLLQRISGLPFAKGYGIDISAASE